MQDLIETFGRHFVSRQQVRALRELVKGEEGEHYANKIAEYALAVATMPKTHETDDAGIDAKAVLHYFVCAANFYIVEKDAGSPEDETPGAQHQAFGLADLYGDGGELGYISLPEIFESGAELDLYWQPKSLREIREENMPPEPPLPPHDERKAMKSAKDSLLAQVAAAMPTASAAPIPRIHSRMRQIDRNRAESLRDNAYARAGFVTFRTATGSYRIINHCDRLRAFSKRINAAFKVPRQSRAAA